MYICLQVTTLVVYIYLLILLFGMQYAGEDDTIDVYVPFNLIVIFVFYMGWLKVTRHISLHELIY